MSTVCGRREAVLERRAWGVPCPWGSCSTSMPVASAEVPGWPSSGRWIRLWRGGEGSCYWCMRWEVVWGGSSPSSSYADSLANSSYVCRVSLSWRRRTAQVILADLRHVSPLVRCTLGMVAGCMIGCGGFGRGPGMPGLVCFCCEDLIGCEWYVDVGIMRL